MPPFLSRLMTRGSLAQQSTAGLFLRVAAVGGGFVYSVLAARLLGPGGYGQVAMAVSVSTTAATFVLLGSNGLAVREVAHTIATKDWGRLFAFLRQSAWFGSIAALVVATGLLLLATRVDVYFHALLFAGLLLPVHAALFWIRGVLQGMSAPILSQIPLEFVRWAIILPVLGGLSLWASSVSVADALGVYLVAMTTALLCGALILRSKLASVERGPRARTRWLGPSLPFLGVAAFGILGTELNTLLLGAFSGPEELGLYQPIARLAPIMLLAREAIIIPIAPKIVELWEQDRQFELKTMIRRAALVCVALTACIVTTIVLGSPWILAAFGDEFVTNQHLVMWIAAAQLFSVTLGPAPQLLAMTGSMAQRLAAQAASLFIHVVTAFALIPTYGSAGAALSLVAAIVSWAMLHWFAAWRTTGLNASIYPSIFQLFRTYR